MRNRKPHPPFLPQEEAEMRRLWAAGTPVRQIAHALSRPAQSVIRYAMSHREAMPRRRKARSQPPTAKPQAPPEVHALVDLMNRRGLSVSELEARSGVCRDAVWGWMRGRNRPRRAMLSYCFEALGATVPDREAQDG